MLRSFKKIVPLAARTKIKWLGYAAMDVVSGAQDPRVPPRRETFIGGGNFVTVGDDFFKTLTQYGLSPDMRVLDVGCGQGRMARPLIGFFDQGDYTGFDIVKPGIEWCQHQYADLPKFDFIHADVFNQRYNKLGKTLAKDYRFPFENDSFERVFLTSVFTHMFADDVENYLFEISRVLKPGGAALITWFLLDEVSRKSAHPVLNFKHSINGISRTTLKSNPEAAIAFDLTYVQKLYDKMNLSIKKIDHGRWARPDSGHNLQDLIIALKPAT